MKLIFERQPRYACLHYLSCCECVTSEWRGELRRKMHSNTHPTLCSGVIFKCICHGRYWVSRLLINQVILKNEVLLNGDASNYTELRRIILKGTNRLARPWARSPRRIIISAVPICRSCICQGSTRLYAEELSCLL